MKHKTEGQRPTPPAVILKKTQLQLGMPQYHIPSPSSILDNTYIQVNAKRCDPSYITPAQDDAYRCTYMNYRKFYRKTMLEDK